MKLLALFAFGLALLVAGGMFAGAFMAEDKVEAAGALSVGAMFCGIVGIVLCCEVLDELRTKRDRAESLAKQMARERNAACAANTTYESTIRELNRQLRKYKQLC